MLSRLVSLFLVVLAAIATAGVFLGPSSAALKISIALVIALAIWRTGDALVIVAAFGPLGGALAAVTGSGQSWAIALMFALFLGAAIRRLVSSPRVGDQALLTVATLYIVLVLTSLATGLWVQQTLGGEPGPFVQAFAHWLFRASWLESPQRYGGVAAAALCGGGVVLFALTEAVGRRNPSLIRPVMTALLAATAALGILSVNRLLEIALRRPPFLSALAEFHHHIRLSPVVPDVNAASALFLLMLPIAFDLLRERSGRLAAGIVLPWLLAGFWLAGSRTALVLLPVSLSLLVIAATRGSLGRAGRRRLSLTLLAVLVAASAAVFVFYPRAEAHGAVHRAIEVRQDMLTTTLRMTRAHPFFGIGIGHYYRASSEYMPQRMRRFYQAQNAHNQFLQVLGELGIIGLFAFLAVLVVALAPGIRLLIGRDAPPGLAGLVVGVTSFLAVSVSMHPLLIPEVALAFWIALGLVRASASAADSQAGPSLRPKTAHAVIAGSVMLLTISVPWRSEAVLRHADLEGVGIGVSEWKVDKAGRRFRTARLPAAVYVPAAADRVRLPLRARRTSARTVELEASVDGRLPIRVRVPVDRWLDFSLILPAPHIDRRCFRRIDLRWITPTRATLDIGREQTPGSAGESPENFR
jgi:O-antigen ligase